MTEIEIGRNKFLDKINEGRAHLKEMEEEALEVNYKTKYENLTKKIKEVEKSAWAQYRAFPEPKWPDAIDDRKKVIWFRNDVFEHAFATGMLGACRQILSEAEES